MSQQQAMTRRDWRNWVLAAILCLAGVAAPAQQSPAAPAPQAKSKPSSQFSGKITPEQARQLFSLVDTLIKFSSDETGLPIKSQVKRQIVHPRRRGKLPQGKIRRRRRARGACSATRSCSKSSACSTATLNSSPFLLALLDEQIEAYYDAKTKTVNMLDWVDVEEQKPVLAHELTHALQDQHSDLEKWSDQTPDDVSLNSTDDAGHLAKDELDTAREAVVEGQATAVMMDYILKPLGKSLVKDPEVMDFVKQQMIGFGRLSRAGARAASAL